MLEDKLLDEEERIHVELDEGNLNRLLIRDDKDIVLLLKVASESQKRKNVGSYSLINC